MYGCNDGIFSWDGDNFTIENNYLHGFTTQAANGHVDGFQTEGAVNGVIRHNTIDVAQDQNSAVAIWNSRRSSDDILVDSNLLAGGGFTVYAEDYSPSEASPVGGYTVTNITFSNNRFSTVHYGCVGSGACGSPAAPRPTGGNAPATRSSRRARTWTPAILRSTARFAADPLHLDRRPAPIACATCHRVG